MNKTVSPIFLFSLPRAGSTLAQRILATHQEIATVAEPWILLPYLYTLKNNGCYAEYGYSNLVTAVNDLLNEFPNGKDDYLAEIHDFILKLYAKTTQHKTKYFLDKTPRYHLIVEEIISMFPEGKFIFLWRNPLAIIASLMETWDNGKWNLYEFKVDLFDGLTNLLKAYKKYSSKVSAVRYEDLITTPEFEWQKVFDYLELEFYPERLDSFNRIQLNGQMGDPSGIKHYQSISKAPLEKWKLTLSNPIRKTWCRRYLKWIGKERLTMMGYDFEQLLSELDSIPNKLKNIGSDFVRLNYGIAYCTLEPYIMAHKIKLIPDWYKIHTLS
ncbi:TPR domain/sulfotransferase domain protein [Candidatus Thiomargarita nelsonii]|uniref:TPR domain/sulfotransferase domain protein n=1 Tax=Candidatus Thiomargarita nelsonii TaxID=1003181 RepID=A0A0A6P2P0_9GAMM|nr:TPR domain/sulfotransferase domain protein [Candidatus Thiomargarita nelsonii]